MDNILNDGQGKEKNRSYKINLGVQDGLAGLVLIIQEKGLWKDINKNGANIDSLEDLLVKVNANLNQDESPVHYTRQGGLDREGHKIVKIIKAAAKTLSASNPSEKGFGQLLLNFAYQAKSAGSDYEKRAEQGYNFSQLVKKANSKNIFQLLCDFNGDGELSVNYYEYQNRRSHQDQWRAEHPEQANNRREERRKDWEAEKASLNAKRKNKENKNNQGDVGTIFGPQLYDALLTATQVADLKIKSTPDARFGSGEQLVIYNIFGLIRSQNTNPKLENVLNDAMKDTTITEGETSLDHNAPNVITEKIIS